MELEKNESKNLKFKIIGFVIFVALIVFVSIKYTPIIVDIISNTDKFKDYILSFGVWGILVFILLQIAHIIIVVIPGELVQIGGGYIFGTVMGTIYTSLGMLIGTIIVFFMTRIFGYSVIKIFLPKNKLEKFNHLINSPKSEIVMFVLYLIPGIPKDTLTYIAGMTPIKPMNFLILSVVARLPGILGSCYIGANLQSKHYMPVIVVSSIAVLLFVLGIIYQDKVIDFLHKLRHKDSHK